MCSETDFTQEKSHFHPTASNSSLLFVAAVTKWSASDIAEPTKLKGREKSMFETPYNEIKCVLSTKESDFNGKNGSKFSHLLTVRADGANPLPPYSQPDCKISVFMTSLARE